MEIRRYIGLSFAALVSLLVAHAHAAGPGAATGPAEWPGMERYSDQVLLQHSLSENFQEITAEAQYLHKIVEFLQNEGGVKMEVDWAGLERSGIARDLQVTVILKELPLTRMIREVAEVAGQGRIALQVDHRILKVDVADDSPAARQRRGAELIAAAAELIQARSARGAGARGEMELGGYRGAADWLIQARVIDGKGDEAKLQAALSRVGEKGFMDAFTADGRLAIPVKLDHRLEEKLQENVKEFTANERRLSDMFYMIGDKLGINCAINWPALKNAGIKGEMPINLTCMNMSGGQVIAAILKQAGPGKLGFVDDEGVLAISTVEDLESAPRYQRVFAMDVRDLVNVSQAGGQPAAPTAARQARADALIAKLKAGVEEKSWKTGDRFIEEASGIVYVRQSWENQKKIAETLAQVRAGK